MRPAGSGAPTVVQSSSALSECPGTKRALRLLVSRYAPSDPKSIGVTPQIRMVLQSVATREAGMAVLCGPAGVGKTRMAEFLQQSAGLTMLGDLRTHEDIVEALRRAEADAVVGVVRSGESFGVVSRWDDMGIAQELIARASVATVTLRRLQTGRSPRATSDLLLVEVVGPDRLLPHRLTR